MIKLLLFSIFFLTIDWLIVEAVRCYKCEASDQCRSLQHGAPSSIDEDGSETFEIAECEYFCWKSISLGNVYRGCAKKRCAVSHDVGAFSSSVCCDSDYCNQSKRIELSTILLLTVLISFIDVCWYG